MAIPPSCLRRSGSGRWSRRATCTASARKKVNSGKMRSATLRACRRFRRQWWLQSWWPSEAAAIIEAAMGEDISQQHGVTRLVGSRWCAPDEPSHVLLRCLMCETGLCVHGQMEMSFVSFSIQRDCVVRRLCHCVEPIDGAACELFLRVIEMQRCVYCFVDGKFVLCISLRRRTIVLCARRVFHVVLPAKKEGEKFRGRVSCLVCETCVRGKCVLCVSVRRRTIYLCARRVFHVVLSAKKEGEKFRGRPCQLFGVRDMCAREVCFVFLSETKNKYMKPNTW